MELSEISEDPDVIHKLEAGLRDAYSLQVQWFEYFGDGMNIGHKGFKEEVAKLRKGLKKITDGRGTEAAAIKSINDAIRFIPEIDLEYFDSFLDDFTPSELPGRFVETVALLSNADTDKKQTAENLLKAVERITANLNHLGRGSANNKARQYTEGINRLREHFAEAMPGYLTNGGRNSVFRGYVEIWLKDYLKKENIQNIDRIIERSN